MFMRSVVQVVAISTFAGANAHSPRHFQCRVHEICELNPTTVSRSPAIKAVQGNINEPNCIDLVRSAELVLERPHGIAVLIL